MGHYKADYEVYNSEQFAPMRPQTRTEFCPLKALRCVPLVAHKSTKITMWPKPPAAAGGGGQCSGERVRSAAHLRSGDKSDPYATCVFRASWLNKFPVDRFVNRKKKNGGERSTCCFRCNQMISNGFEFSIELTI
ncbi:hypothetical protein EVAR_50303_1 [Eumeta japonica]|uniref:Uncharacterized protein n=1 Tax=Eumeta variegata TaxID=151549 RepID=A0A4C1XTR2_EUMVA|nr:hypothetical protein EVAR_50303_1 [Eumeta japonica]